jgi:hypothetical protein
MTFDYELPAELFTAKRGARSRLGYRRFATAAEAILAARRPDLASAHTPLLASPAHAGAG